MFKDSLENLLVAALCNRAMKIANPTIWLCEEATDSGAADVNILRSRREECLVSVIALGVLREKPAMRDAAAEMHNSGFQVL